MSEEDAGSASQSELDELDNELQGTILVFSVEAKCVFS